MKFSLFAHMERVDGSVPHETLYQNFISLAQMADEGGMQTVWTGEHHTMEFTITPNPFLSLVDLAHHTKNVRLGTGTIIAPFWHPIKLAGEAAMADLITGGRIELGIARGAYSHEYERLVPGLDAWQAGQRMREIVPLLRPLWQGDYAHEGEFYSFPATSITPGPLQTEGPPLWIAARDPKSHEFAIENQCNVQVTPLWQGKAEIETLAERYKQACTTHLPKGHKPKLMLLHHCYIGKDDADVEQAAKELSRYFNYFGAWFKNERPVSRGFIKEITQEEIEANAMMSAANLARDLTIGTIENVIERIKYYEELGYDEFSLWIDSAMSFERKRASLARFIEEVMPRFN